MWLNITSSSWEILTTSWSLDLNFSWTWILTRDHLELLKIKDNSFYVNQDTFSYLLVLVVVWVLLMKTLIKIFIVFFMVWFKLVNWVKLWKK